MLAHVILRVRQPELERPYRTPGGILTTGVALVLAVVRHRLVSNAPEEEFEAIERAESELH